MLPGTPNPLLAAATVAAALRGREAEIEARRRLPDDVAALLSASGVLRLLTPLDIGGQEVEPSLFFRAVETIAEADGASGWCTMIACTATVIAAYLPREVAAALFGDPSTRAAGIFAPRGRAVPQRQGGVDGFVIDGRWPWGSAVHAAQVVSLGCIECGADGTPLGAGNGVPRTLTAVLARSAVIPLDNWESLGLGGTGSGEIEVRASFVPAQRIVRIPGDAPLPRPLYRFPIFGLLALGIAAVSCGRGRRALVEFKQLALRRSPQGSRRSLAERGTVQQAVAIAEAQLRAARAFVLEAVAQAWAEAQHDQGIGLAARRDLRLACSQAAHASSAVAERLYTLAGGDAVFSASALQRAWRDTHVAQQHLMVAEPSFELFGRLLLELPTDTAML